MPFGTASLQMLFGTFLATFPATVVAFFYVFGFPTFSSLFGHVTLLLPRRIYVKTANLSHHSKNWINPIRKTAAFFVVRSSFLHSLFLL